MFLVLWEFEVKPGCEKRFERVHARTATGLRCFAAIRTMRELTCSAKRPSRGCI
jgi:hypothetical protein